MIFGSAFRESVEVIGAAQATPLEFNKGVPEYALALFTFLVTGTAAHNGIGGDGITRYQLVMDNDLIVDVTPAELRALFEYLYSRYGGQVPATTAVAWEFPMYLLQLLAPLLDNGNMPTVGLPAGTDKLVRWQLNANSAAGSVKLGWSKSPKDVTHSPLMLGRAISGLTAATPDERVEINWQPITTVGIIISGIAHFDRVRVFLADAKGVTQQVTDLLHDQILALLDPYNVQSITDPLFIPLDVPAIFAKGSYILFDTNGGYTGQERMVPVQLVDERQPAPAGK